MSNRLYVMMQSRRLKYNNSMFCLFSGSVSKFYNWSLELKLQVYMENIFNNIKSLRRKETNPILFTDNNKTFNCLKECALALWMSFRDQKFKKKTFLSQKKKYHHLILSTTQYTLLSICCLTIIYAILN